MKTEKIALRITPEDKQQLQKDASNDSRTVSGYITSLIKKASDDSFKN